MAPTRGTVRTRRPVRLSGAIYWSNSASAAGPITRCGALVANACVPLHRQVSEESRRRLMGNREARLPKVAKLSGPSQSRSKLKRLIRRLHRLVASYVSRWRISASSSPCLAPLSLITSSKTLLYRYGLCAEAIVLTHWFKTHHRSDRFRGATARAAYGARRLRNLRGAGDSRHPLVLARWT